MIRPLYAPTKQDTRLAPQSDSSHRKIAVLLLLLLLLLQEIKNLFLFLFNFTYLRTIGSETFWNEKRVLANESQLNNFMTWDKEYHFDAWMRSRRISGTTLLQSWLKCDARAVITRQRLPTQCSESKRTAKKKDKVNWTWRQYCSHALKMCREKDRSRQASAILTR